MSRNAGMKTAQDVREACRRQELQSPTSGLASGYVQANLVMLPSEWAFDFLLFCQRNPKPCPLLEVLEAGQFAPRRSAADADLRTDLPKYCIYESGILKSVVPNVKDRFQDDFVSFLIGCSFTFEAAILEQGVPVRHIEENRNVPMYRTNRLCKSAGRFSGPLVVSMRPMTPRQAIQAVEICTDYPLAHGAPVHWGDPASLGIANLKEPDYGDAVTLQPGEIPVFWACGVTPQAALQDAKPTLAITHAPGHMFLTDLRDWQMKNLDLGTDFFA